MLRESTLADRAFRRTLRGARLASISVLAGGIATLASLLAVAYVAAVGSGSDPFNPPAVRLASAGALERAVSARLHAARDEKPEHVPLRPVRETHIGRIVMVDVGPDVVSLDDELESQQSAARRQGQRVALWLVVEDCKPCTAIESALPTPEMQEALAGARLVRLDAADFIAELARIGVPLDAFPSFVLLDAAGRAMDYVHGGEWDADVPKNIAPVLKSFVEGTYVERRSPWRGGLHEDETPI